MVLSQVLNPRRVRLRIAALPSMTWLCGVWRVGFNTMDAAAHGRTKEGAAEAAPSIVK
jgi:hypothetical protein